MQVANSILNIFICPCNIISNVLSCFYHLIKSFLETFDICDEDVTGEEVTEAGNVKDFVDFEL